MLTECCHRTVISRCEDCPYDNPRYCAALDVVRAAQTIENLMTGPHLHFTMEEMWDDISDLLEALAAFKRVNLTS